MIPPQVQRLLIAVALAAGGFLLVRSQLVPDSFGVEGHFRADSIGEIAALPVKYAGEEACIQCHAGIDEARLSSRHAPIHCESCHGPAREHSLDPVANAKPRIENPTHLCLGCHEANPTRPADFPQILSSEHRPGIGCIECHNPHSPKEVRL